MFWFFISLILIVLFFFRFTAVANKQKKSVLLAVQTNSSFHPQIDEFKVEKLNDYYIYLEAGNIINDRAFIVRLFENVTDIKKFLKKYRILQENLLKGTIIKYYIRKAEPQDYDNIFREKSIKQEYRNCIKLQTGMEQAGKILNCEDILNNLIKNNAD